MHHATTTINTINLAARSGRGVYCGVGTPFACTVEEGAGLASKHGSSWRAAASASVQATVDHLGNNRVLFSDRNGDGAVDSTEIIQENHYYAFGLEMNGAWQRELGPEQRYGYNGKELVGEVGLYEYGFRWYDPTVGRFTGVDPISDQFAWVSTYNYAENEPVANIDLHGLQRLNYLEAQILERLNNTLGRPAEKLNSFFSKTQASAENQKRIDLTISGVKNTALGLFGATAAVKTAPFATGYFAIAGVATLFSAGVGEATVGVTQILDATLGKGDENSFIHQSESVPGMIAHSQDSEYAGLIDAGAQVIPALMTGGLPAATGARDFVDGAVALRNGDVLKVATKTFTGKDAFGDMQSFVSESVKVTFGENTTGQQKKETINSLLRTACPSCNWQF